MTYSLDLIDVAEQTIATRPEQAQEQRQRPATTREQRQTMTAAQAVSFERESAQSAAIVAAQLACTCDAYRDVFTFNRWKAQGFSVRKGEKAARVPGFITKTRTNATTGEPETSRIPRTNCVFCRCQVEPTTPRPAKS